MFDDVDYVVVIVECVEEVFGGGDYGVGLQIVFCCIVDCDCQVVVFGNVEVVVIVVDFGGCCYVCCDFDLWMFGN